MNPSLFVWLQRLAPQQWLTRLAGRLGYCKTRWFKSRLIRWFIKKYRVNLEEAHESDPDAYPHFNAFFTRTLKPQARVFAQSPRTIISPCDGAVSQCGRIEQGQIIQAKGRQYSVEALLAGQEHLFRHFSAGQFATLYLSPSDYHRFHMPTDGRLVAMSYVPGQLFSVNPVTCERVDNLFARNTRVATLFDTPAGPMAMVFVGAMIVSGVHLRWAGDINPSPRALTHWHYGGKDSEFIQLKRGEECGFFYAGSTIVLLMSEGCQWEESLAPTGVIRVGQPIGSY